MTNTNDPMNVLYHSIEDMSNSYIECPRCHEKVPDAPYCLMCGRALKKKTSKRHRGNGQGTVVKRGNKYRAIVTLGYYVDEQGKTHRKTRSKTFDKKSDAVSALVSLRAEKTKPTIITLKELYVRWEPTHRAGASTMGCYKAAFKHLESLWFVPVPDLTVDDLQDCLDDCDRGKRTKENMRALLRLMFKYAVPRKLAEMNLAEYLSINAEGSGHKSGFTKDQIELISKTVGKVTGADLILCMIYTGFRPSEFLALTGASYDKARGCLIGGAKTEAGKNRVVTISPKIAPLVPSVAPDDPLFCGMGLRAFTEKVFYPALEAVGIPNPLIEVGKGITRHTYTPHSCRHTFATLMKGVPGADKDKLELIGHSSSEMLRYYQDVGLEDLRKITDRL